MTASGHGRPSLSGHHRAVEAIGIDADSNEVDPQHIDRRDPNGDRVRGEPGRGTRDDDREHSTGQLAGGLGLHIRRGEMLRSPKDRRHDEADRGHEDTLDMPTTAWPGRFPPRLMGRRERRRGNRT
jgi:hypothetical protein